MHESAYKMIYQDAVWNLMNGCLMPWDRDILSQSPLPNTVIEPYLAKEVPDVRESMRLTYETMVVWIDEAKKANYFSKRFIQLSKMVMNGVTAMGRGLITLHARGEELDSVPMSIHDLIGVASYHFRKSHLGVLQTVKSHPEVSERLLMNQISWNNMLMRLFKTQEKLAKPMRVAGIKGPGAGEDPGSMIHGSGAGGSDLLPAGEQEPGLSLHGTVPAEQSTASRSLTEAKDGDFDPFKVFGPAERGISKPAAIREPGSFTAPRAFASFDPSVAGKRGPEAGGNEKAGSKNQENESRLRPLWGQSHEGTVPDLQDPEIRENEGNETKNETKENSEADKNEGHKTIRQTEFSEKDEKREECDVDRDRDGDGPLWGQSHEGTVPDMPAPDMPRYLQILQDVFSRSGPSEDGEVAFTYDEIIYLAADPDFNRIYPDQAAQMHLILQRINSS